MKRPSIPFIKYSGCGNDFVIIDNRTGRFPCDDKSLIKKLCHRQKGVGADGILLLGSVEGEYTMRIFNADGSEAAMCGNGLRCLAKFIDTVDRPNGSFTIRSPYGKHHIEMNSQQVSATIDPPSKCLWNQNLVIDGKGYPYHFLNTGVPHAIFFVDDLQEVDVDRLGRAVRYHPNFASAGTNATFVQLHQQGVLSFRTYERGVEAETLACGTGGTAAALAAAHLHQWGSPIEAITKEGSSLSIHFSYGHGQFSSVKMEGPAEEIYHGIIA